MKKSNIKKIIKSILEEVIQEVNPATKGMLASRRDEVQIRPMKFGELLQKLNESGVELEETQQIELFRQLTMSQENVGSSHGVIGGHPVKSEQDPLNPINEIHVDMKKAEKIAHKMWGSVYKVNFHGEKNGEYLYKVMLHSPTGPVKWIKYSHDGKWHIQSDKMRWERVPLFHPTGRKLENQSN